MSDVDRVTSSPQASPPGKARPSPIASASSTESAPPHSRPNASNTPKPPSSVQSSRNTTSSTTSSPGPNSQPSTETSPETRLTAPASLSAGISVEPRTGAPPSSTPAPPSGSPSHRTQVSCLIQY